MASNQEQIADIFEFKWKKSNSYAGEAMRHNWRNWLRIKYFDDQDDWLREKFASKQNIRMLDAGCGAGVSSLLLFDKYVNKCEYIGIDISNSITQARSEFKKAGLKGSFLQINLMDIPENLGQFDIIFSEGVLHHTNDVQTAISKLSTRLSRNGHLLFYVYKRKAILREFSDDFIRKILSEDEPEVAWNKLKDLTELGIAFGELDVEIEVRKDIQYLGIKKGKYNLQRFIYYNFLKMFYSKDMSFEEMLHVNFDWFTPKNCWRHSREEIKKMIEIEGLELERLYEDDSGITVIAKK